MPYDDSQPRDKSGMWTSGGSSGGGLPPSAYAAGISRLPGSNRLNGREAAVAGIGLHNREYAQKLKASGQYVDVYSRENGDKVEAKVTRVGADSYTMKTSPSNGSKEMVFKFGEEGDPMAGDRAARKAEFQARIKANKQRNASYRFGSTEVPVGMRSNPNRESRRKSNFRSTLSLYGITPKI